MTESTEHKGGLNMNYNVTAIIICQLICFAVLEICKIFKEK